MISYIITYGMFDLSNSRVKKKETTKISCYNESPSQINITFKLSKLYPTNCEKNIKPFAKWQDNGNNNDDLALHQISELFKRFARDNMIFNMNIYKYHFFLVGIFNIIAAGKRMQTQQ